MNQFARYLGHSEVHEYTQSALLARNRTGVESFVKLLVAFVKDPLLS